MSRSEPVGVVLFQLGGPDSLDTIEPFLYNLFTDPDIIDLPLAFLFRRPLARLISRKRAPKVREYYRMIGGKSPIARITERQAEALAKALSPELDARVYVAMRYWHPYTHETLSEIQRDGIRRIVLLPLYPQYSIATTGSSLNEWERVLSRNGMDDIQYKLIREYCDHPSYVSAIVDCIEVALNRLPEKERSRVHLVFSAHGTPVKLVKKGDPYQEHVLRTCAAVLKEGNFGLEHTICYQSKVGPEKWLEPSFDSTLEHLAEEKKTHLLVVPVAFVSDHIETLHEINIEGRGEALELGIEYYDMAPALNTNPLFISALADLVLKNMP